MLTQASVGDTRFYRAGLSPGPSGPSGPSGPPLLAWVPAGAMSRLFIGAARPFAPIASRVEKVYADDRAKHWPVSKAHTLSEQRPGVPSPS